MAEKVSFYISVKAFDGTDDGYLILYTSVERQFFKRFVPGAITVLSTGTPAAVLGVGLTFDEAKARSDAYLAAVEQGERNAGAADS